MRLYVLLITPPQPPNIMQNVTGTFLTCKSHILLPLTCWENPSGIWWSLPTSLTHADVQGQQLVFFIRNIRIGAAQLVWSSTILSSIDTFLIYKEVWLRQHVSITSLTSKQVTDKA